jgi:hypothetical protein
MTTIDRLRLAFEHRYPIVARASASTPEPMQAY